ncbi:MAG TPA: hypothetical protein VFK16_08320 [Gemmatimonadaceae bacterium]|nr:hypothetical protein [Gemmatimonadaceae bacterium]
MPTLGAGLGFVTTPLTALLLCAAPLAAQGGAGITTPPGQHRTATGVVVRPGPDSSRVPVARQLVVLHRVGQDHSGPLDSTVTNARGVYHFTYVTSGSADALYFASSNVAGIAYFTAPYKVPSVTSPDGDLMVFDTTSRGAALQSVGWHLVVAAPGVDGVRQVTEVFDLANNGTRTLVVGDSIRPLWTGQLPDGAKSPVVSGGDIAPGGTVFSDRDVRLFAPVSPGVHQLAVTFGLSSSAFPLEVPFAQGAAVVELLVEEESATPVMAGLVQQASVSTQGRNFKRYLAQDAPPGAVLLVRVGDAGGASRTRFIAGVVFAMAVIMALALIATLMHRRPAAAAGAGSSREPGAS